MFDDESLVQSALGCLVFQRRPFSDVTRHILDHPDERALRLRLRSRDRDRIVERLPGVTPLDQCARLQLLAVAEEEVHPVERAHVVAATFIDEPRVIMSVPARDPTQFAMLVEDAPLYRD